MANQSPPNGEHTGATDTARRDLDAAKDTARADFDEMKHRAGEDLEAVKREARAEFDNARREASTYAEGQKNYAADQISGIASAFERVGDELRSGEQSWAGRYAGDMAHRLQDMADRTRNSSLDEIVGDVEQFGRERPAAFLSAAALLGFAASRFLKASSHRRYRPGSDRYSSSAYAGDPYYAARGDGMSGDGISDGSYDAPNTGEQS